MIQEGESAAATEGAAPTYSLSQNCVLLPPRAGEHFNKVKPGQGRQEGTQNRMKLYLWTFFFGQGSSHLKKKINQAKATKPSDSKMTVSNYFKHCSKGGMHHAEKLLFSYGHQS